MQPDTSICVTREQVTQLAWRCAGAGMAAAGADLEELEVIGRELEPTLDELVAEFEAAQTREGGTQ